MAFVIFCTSNKCVVSDSGCVCVVFKSPHSSSTASCFCSIYCCFSVCFGKLSIGMKTINMDIMQNIFLMKHFTQCTIFSPPPLHGYYTHFKQMNKPPCTNPENGMWRNERKNTNCTSRVDFCVLSKTANKPQGEMKVCRLKEIKWV